MMISYKENIYNLRLNNKIYNLEWKYNYNNKIKID